MSIIIQNVLLDERQVDILIKGGIINKIGHQLNLSADTLIDGSEKAAIPSFVNAHTHSAMTLMRSYADDMKLHDWLENKIWPFEKNITEEDVYWGTRLACIEMIKTGTTHFNDMYWHYRETARAVIDSGIHANLSSAFIDLGNETITKNQMAEQIELYNHRSEFAPNITFTLGIHSLYTVSKSGVEWTRDFAKEHNIKIHMHLSETEKEVDEWVEKTGMRPIEYLDKIDMLSPNLIAAHVNWVTDDEIKLLADNDVGIVHCPTSNMKLASGVFPYQQMKKAGVRIGLATDGAASNNNIDMLDEMKVAALLQKSSSQDPTVMPAEEVFELATKGSASLFDLNMGEISIGKSADLLLVDLNNIHLIPNHHLIPNLVYSAHSGCIDTTIAKGRILMENGKVKDEEKVIEEFQKSANKLVQG
ncbi:MAG: amidohydrolase [Candidatus Marinimicrobia bacterium]|nr:amidohydrolase [Candidatus Neomarinimicrobiota bacterium]MBL7010966.1 amidohydrolase [Candidatus Neomarinimicrobiota bacterium]MBL7031389.1 amidohydrolase [Candidatus Neomarinimicrobiota bacterium]